MWPIAYLKQNHSGLINQIFSSPQRSLYILWKSADSSSLTRFGNINIVFFLYLLLIYIKTIEIVPWTKML